MNPTVEQNIRRIATDLDAAGRHDDATDVLRALDEIAELWEVVKEARRVIQAAGIEKEGGAK